MVNVVGLGYIGLPTALMLAANGVEVTGTDYNRELVETLNKGKTTFKEDGLDELFKEAVKSGIRFSEKYISTDMYIISVPTPYNKASKKIDASYVTAAVKNVLEVCPNGATLVIESTVSPGTIDRFVRPAIEEKGLAVGKDIHLAHAPERIIPGNMAYELKHNSRTIGADEREVGERVKRLYASFCEGEIVVTDIRTAEMTKVVENTFRDINIAFANELAKICRSDSMDVYEILVGDYPGLANIILAARKINDGMPEFVLGRIYEIMKKEGITDVSRVGLYGLTYKEDVDDMRESPTLQMLECMERHLAGGRVKVYDPYIEAEVVANQYHGLDAFLEDVDLVVVMVGHEEIRENEEKLREKVVLDTRNICKLCCYHL